MKLLLSISEMKYVILLLFSLTIFNSCRDEMDNIVPPEPENTDKQVGNLVLPSTTFLLNEASLNRLSVVSEDKSAVRFNDSNAQLDSIQVGDIIMIGVTPSTPRGSLRKVTAIDQAEGIQFETEQATLSEAIKEGSLSLIKNISSADIEEVVYADGVTAGLSGGRLNADALSLNLAKEVAMTSGAQAAKLSLNGSLTLDPKVEFNMEFNFFQLDELLFKVNLNANSTIESSLVGASAFETEKIILASYTIKPIVIYGVVLSPILNIYANADGSVEAGLSKKYTTTADGALGLSYSQASGWENLNSFNSDFSLEPFSPVAEASVKLNLASDVKLFIFGLAGPGVEIQPYLKTTVDLQSPTCWEVFTGLEASAKVESNIIGENIMVERELSLGIEDKIAEGTGCEAPGHVQGLVRDAVSNELLEGVKVNVLLNGNKVIEGITNSQGEYKIAVPPNSNYFVYFEKEGYIDTEMYSISVTSEEITFLEGVLSIDNIYAGNGNFAGTVVDAFTGEGVSGANLLLRSGLNNISFGDVIATTFTKDNGSYTFENIPAGNYTVEVKKVGYNNSFFSAICIGGQTTGEQNGNISPFLADNEIRVVLTWGENPLDLDAHITGPSSNGGRFHTYWFNLSPTGATASLDLDDTESFGPETITIREPIDGVYRYSVHDYTNRKETESNGLAFSGAKVKVYKGNTGGEENGLIAEFNVPNEPGTLWTVFEMEGGEFRAVNAMEYESSSSSVQRRKPTDADVIRYLPEKE